MTVTAPSRATEHDLTVGKVIRAYRMGYGVWRNFFVRLSGDGPFLVEVHPIELIPNNLHGKPYRVWWSKEAPTDLDLIPIIKSLVACKRPFSFYIDDNGCRV